MIWEALSFLSNELNNSFRTKMDLTEDLVILSNIVNPDGSAALPEGIKVIVSLVKIEPENTPTPYQAKRPPLLPQSLNLNVYVMFSVSSKAGNYAEALKLLGRVIGFFQNKSVFSHQNSPALSKQINKLSLELSKLEFMEQSNLWSALGAKYLPSVVYKIRTLTFDNDNFIGAWPMISGLDTDKLTEK